MIPSSQNDVATWTKVYSTEQKTTDFFIPSRREEALQGSATTNASVIEQSRTAQQGATEKVLILAQTADGFLWLGRFSGLFRFVRAPGSIAFMRHRAINCFLRLCDQYRKITIKRLLLEP
jgi:hypothetical protein